MGSTIPTDELPALRTQPKIIFFTDFDGTITVQDSNDWLTDNLGYGREKRRAANIDVLEGRVDFRDVFTGMLESVPVPFNKCVDLLLENVELDPAFARFYEWCRDNNVPIVILSGGMRPIIQALLRKLIGEEAVSNIQIVSNDVAVSKGKATMDEPNGWEIVFHDDSGFGHDKSIEIRKYSSLKERPIMLYAGDGVSDLSAAKETDLLFAKEGRDLVKFCETEKVPYTTFSDFSSILETVKDLSDGKLSVKDVAKKFD
ncbi:hypothetical protein MCOR25_004835 [Pyricularia grisea]|uniref:Phosphoserine phosphatase n=1 Tax=Pyricularia grisea TaxID=148305 RepID=A0A6P8B159_PYRGI|nr:uncharacterized protein PgNI_07354 [Pyricularia grisea]KAI6367759.1 hypothetical protein MCOR25_004835 [Pyricularia grisea]TLD08569.1 hypothetical protein PgNI_07354 [Pyricularia grisea]